MPRVNPRKFFGSMLVLGCIAVTLHAGMQPGPAQERINVLLDGRLVGFGGAAPVQIGGRVLVPLRGVFEAMGAVVDYDGATQTVFASHDQTQIQLRIGSRQATVNEETRFMDVPAQVRLGRTLVPLRFVSEALGADVSWNEAQRTVYIVTGAMPPPVPQPTALPDVQPTAQPTAEPTVQPTPNYPVGQPETRTGIVTRNLRADGFELRINVNTFIDVQATRSLPAGLGVGDRVAVTGELVEDVMTASTVRIVAQAVPVRKTIQGTVIAVLSATRLTLSGAAATPGAPNVTVDTRVLLNTGISAGDMVSATGLLTGNYMDAESVKIVGSGNNTNNDDIEAQPVNFTGTVDNINAATRTVQVRGDNGTLYVVRYTGVINFARNDRVRVTGTYAKGVTTAKTIKRL
ncbi:MAG TPA: stalk domain-containing protein [Abditibacteriaceae bacterium]|nr:stalk domain-containing protein [Abditibacteriaceae bacterium]